MIYLASMVKFSIKSFIICINLSGEDNFVTYENGYDNRDQRMNAFFIGIGPSFKAKPSIESKKFKLTHVYPLLKKLLDLKCPASDVQPSIKLRSCIEELLKDGTPNYMETNASDEDDGPLWKTSSNEWMSRFLDHDKMGESNSEKQDEEESDNEDGVCEENQCESYQYDAKKINAEIID